MIRLLLISFCLTVALYATAQKNRITVEAGVVLNRIPATLYGSCIEDVNHEIYGGLYDQKIMGESFEEPASGLNYRDWKKYAGYWAAEREYSDESISILPGRHTRRMIAKNELGVEPDENAKLIYDAQTVNDGTIASEMRFLQARGDGGSLFIRVSHPGVGENALYGYEIRLSREEEKLKLIKHQNKVTLLDEQPVTFFKESWNDIKINFSGAHILIYLNGDKLPLIDYIDSNAPILSGKIGVGTTGSPLSFRNIMLVNGGNSKKLILTYPADQQISDRWDKIQSPSAEAKFSLPQQGAFNGLATQVVEFIGGNRRIGIANRSLNRWGIAVQQNQTFTGSLYLHTASGSLPVTVALESCDGSKVYAKQIFKVTGTAWKKHDFSFTAIAADTAARFALYLEQKGKLYIDQVTLTTTGEKQFKGLPLRADIGNALVSEGLTFVRYAGSMVNAGGYRFKKMIGDRATRPPYTGHWNEYATNGFGIEEFLQFCEAAHFTAAFAINIEETAQDAADMVEYLNGDLSTEWGKKRAENGHPKPYGVKYIEIGNEEVLFEGDKIELHDHYTDRFLDLYKAIHAKDSSIKLVCSVWWRPESANTERDFKKLDGKAAYWDYHVGGDDPASGLSVDKELTRMQSLFLQWNPSTTMKCAIFEENGGLHNLSRALGHATNLNAVRRHGDFLLTSCPANALQPFLQNDNGWDQGQIFFTPTQVWGMAPYYAQQMAAQNHLPLRVKDRVEGNLDVTATRSEDGKIVVLHVVNTDTASQATSLMIDHFGSRKKNIRVWTLSGNPEDRNTPENLDQIMTKKSMLTAAENGMIDYSFPPNSYTILRFEK